MLTKTDLTAIKKVVGSSLDVKLEPLKKDIRKIKSDLKTTINFLDKENIKTLNRVKVIEVQLGIPEPGII